MIAVRASSSNRPQPPISERVRKQPRQRPLLPSTMQTLMQGVVMGRGGLFIDLILPIWPRRSSRNRSVGQGVGDHGAGAGLVWPFGVKVHLGGGDPASELEQAHIRRQRAGLGGAQKVHGQRCGDGHRLLAYMGQDHGIDGRVGYTHHGRARDDAAGPQGALIIGQDQPRPTGLNFNNLGNGRVGGQGKGALEKRIERFGVEFENIAGHHPL